MGRSRATSSGSSSAKCVNRRQSSTKDRRQVVRICFRGCYFMSLPLLSFHVLPDAEYSLIDFRARQTYLGFLNEQHNVGTIIQANARLELHVLLCDEWPLVHDGLSFKFLLG